MADIAFAFNNRKMLMLLCKRYKYMRDANFEKAQQVENKLTELKNTHYDQLIVPNTFYCTFMEGIGQ